MKQASGGDVGRHTERTVGMRKRATRVVPAQNRGPWHAAGNEGRNAAPKRWNATVSTGRGLKKAEKCGGRLSSIANTTPQKYIFQSKTPLFYQNIYYFCLVSATESLTFLGRSVVPRANRPAPSGAALNPRHAQRHRHTLL